jgi:hypothetical protein
MCSRNTRQNMTIIRDQFTCSVLSLEVWQQAPVYEIYLKAEIVQASMVSIIYLNLIARNQSFIMTALLTEIPVVGRTPHMQGST